MKNMIAVKVNVKKADPLKCVYDLLCVGVWGEDKLDKFVRGVDGLLDGGIRRLIDLGDFKGLVGSSALLYGNGSMAAKRVLLIGLGDKKKAKLDGVRNAASLAGFKAIDIKAEKVCMAIGYAFGGKFDIGQVGQATAEGIYMGSYRYDEFVAEDKKDGRVGKVVFDIAESDADTLKKIRRGVQCGVVIGESQNLARTLCNRPANYVYPQVFADEAKKLAKGIDGLSCTVFNEKQLEAKGMGGIVAVGKGSPNKPRMIILKYTPKGKAAGELPMVGLIGKAITFDSGGISLKPGAGMQDMKMDMTGGAAVLGAMKAIAELGLGVCVYGVICAAENAPSGDSYRPGDISTTYSGKTVEILNTDAEGRMVLCDGIAYAKELGCEPIVDIATLTGACMVALGKHKAGLMSNDDGLVKQLQGASVKSGEALWHLPCGDEYAEEMQSKIADLKNMGGKWGGSCNAGSFLGEFAGETKWAHLDIAGKMDASAVMTKIMSAGSLGFGVRLFVSFIDGLAKKK